MRFFQKMSLRHKFISCLVLSAFVLGACLCIIIYYHFNSIMEKEVSHRSQMLLSQAASVQSYVQLELRPEMYDLVGDDNFILKAMSSSYISRKVMEKLDTDEKKRLYYRRVALNPRNPDFAPTDFEKKLINKFKNNRNMDFLEEASEFKGTKYHLVAKPVKFTRSCMVCHGNPEDAPEKLIDKYGDKNGFFHKENEIAGVVVAGFPVQMIKDPVKEITIQYLSLYALWLLLFACIIGLFFDRLVMKNLKKVGEVFESRFSGEEEKKIIEKLEKKDEIEGLIEGVDELAGSLFEANKKLEYHSHNLEEKISERTKELELTAEKHLSDLSLFSGLIARFTDTFNAEDLINDALERIGRRYSAKQVVYYCTVASDNFFTWIDDGSVKKIDDDIKKISWEERILFRENRIYIPVSSHESYWGILCIIFEQEVNFDDFDEAVLLSLGLQLGSSLENIHAVSDIKYQNELLESVFEGITDPLVLIDKDFRVIFANKGSSNFFNTSSGNNLDLTEIIKDADINAYSIEHQEEPVLKEIETKDKKYFRVYFYPLPKRDPGSLRMVMYARDITMEKGLIEGMYQAERLSSIGKMAAGMAHEINNPLGVIRCYADLLSDSVKDEKNISDLNVIINQTRNVQKIVQNLLNFSRAKHFVSGKCSINNGVENIIDLFRPRASSKNINIRFVPERSIPEINCDSSILGQIITNIILNAFDAVGSDGNIEIRTFKKKNEAILEISDDGEGINKDILENIFDPFFTTKDVGKGTGLGLSVVYGFISEIGGRIEAESSDVTVFRLYFPFYEITGDENE